MRSVALFMAVLASSCLYDPDERCGAGQELEGDVCACAEGTIVQDGRCVPCGEHEVASGDHCACEPGWARDEQGVCTPATDEASAASPIGQGEPCESHSDCAGTQATYCESVFLHQCLVEGCAAEGAAPCSEGWRCCDFTELAGVSVCIDLALLEDGSCPAP